MTTQNPHFQLRLGLVDELTPGLRRAEQQVEASARRMGAAGQTTGPRQLGMFDEEARPVSQGTRRGQPFYSARDPQGRFTSSQGQGVYTEEPVVPADETRRQEEPVVAAAETRRQEEGRARRGAQGWQMPLRAPEPTFRGTTVTDERALDALMGRPSAQRRGPADLPPDRGVETPASAQDALMGRGGAQDVRGRERPVSDLDQRRQQLEQQRIAEEEATAQRVRNVRQVVVNELAKFGIELARINKERAAAAAEAELARKREQGAALERVERYYSQSDELAAEAMAASAGGGAGGGVPPGDVPRRPAGAGPPSPDRDAWFRRESPAPRRPFAIDYLSGDRTARMREAERQPELERYLVERQRVSQQLQEIARTEGQSILDDLREQERLLADMRLTAPDDPAVAEKHQVSERRVQDFEKINTGLVRMAESGELADRYLENTTSRVVALGTAADSEEMLRYADSLHIVGNEYRTIGMRWRDAQQSGIFLTDMTKRMQTGFQTVASSAQGMMLGMSALEGNIIGLTFSLIFLQFAGLGGLALAAGGATLALGGTLKAVVALMEKRKEQQQLAAGLGFETLDPEFAERERARGEDVFREQFVPRLAEGEPLTPALMAQIEKQFEIAYANMQSRFQLDPVMQTVAERRPDLVEEYRTTATHDLFAQLLSRSAQGQELTPEVLQELAREVADNVVEMHRLGRGLYPRGDDVFVTPEVLRQEVVDAAIAARKEVPPDRVLGVIPQPGAPQDYYDEEGRPRQGFGFGAPGVVTPGQPWQWPRLPDIREEEPIDWSSFLSTIGRNIPSTQVAIYVTGNTIGTREDGEGLADAIARKFNEYMGRDGRFGIPRFR